MLLLFFSARWLWFTALFLHPLRVYPTLWFWYIYICWLVVFFMVSPRRCCHLKTRSKEHRYGKRWSRSFRTDESTTPSPVTDSFISFNTVDDCGFSQEPGNLNKFLLHNHKQASSSFFIQSFPTSEFLPFNVALQRGFLDLTVAYRMQYKNL